jgi:phosphopantothenoylcysteine decarboxylase/phosphopantothenate--cysteine ligase
MDAGMYEHAATQSNLTTLRQRGVSIVGPGSGRMASGLVGRGRMLEPEELVGHVRLALGRGGQLAGRKVVVTAGGTQEPLDPVRAITNRSSGKQGFALAQAALDRGATVTLISGATALATPVGAQRVDVRTTEEMQKAVLEEASEADVLLMAAAVADFRPVEPSHGKMRRSKGVPELKLEPTPDILTAVAKQRAERGRPRITVGFAAETGDLLRNARAKLEEKQLTLIVANDITAPDAGFEVDTNRVMLVDVDGGMQELPLMTKVDVAEMLLERVVQLLETSVPSLP